MYFAVVVMSTVGLGDVCPRTFAGRALTVVWIILRSDFRRVLCCFSLCHDRLPTSRETTSSVTTDFSVYWVIYHSLEAYTAKLQGWLFSFNCVFKLLQPCACHHALRRYILQFWDVGTRRINTSVQIGHVYLLPY